MAKVCFLFTNVGEGVFSEVRVAPVQFLWDFLAQIGY